MKADYFVYTGNAYPHKNLSRLIDAILLIKTKLKIVSGRNIFIDRLQIEIKIKNAQKYVEVLGFVPDEELDKIYKNSIAFVFPTLAEGFGLPPKEAIKAGTLAVVSDIPVLKEVYEDSVDYFDPMDINSIVESLQKIMNYTKSQREVKIKYAKEFVKKYSWSKMAKETLKIYEEVGK
ncbi:MAG: glycosyltransferase [Patescibacteria group bacterium]